MALFFPQLSSGVVAQFPLARFERWRTVVNESADGWQFRYADDADRRLNWRWTYESLSDGERDRLVGFFKECRGRLHSFAFADPMENLLVWSEDFAREDWERDAMISVLHGASDPLGTVRASALTNAGGVSARLRQTIALPGRYVSTLSLYARSTNPVDLVLTCDADVGNTSARITVGPAWRRFLLRCCPQSESESSTFGLEIPAHATAEVFGLQVEAQPGASYYKRTTFSSGLHEQCRFATDELAVTTRGPNDHLIVVQLESPRGA